MCHEKTEPPSRFEKFFWRAIAVMILVCGAAVTTAVCMVPVKMWTQDRID